MSNSRVHRTRRFFRENDEDDDEQEDDIGNLDTFTAPNRRASSTASPRRHVSGGRGEGQSLNGPLKEQLDTINKNMDTCGNELVRGVSFVCESSM